MRLIVAIPILMTAVLSFVLPVQTAENLELRVTESPIANVPTDLAVVAPMYISSTQAMTLQGLDDRGNK